MKSYCHFVVSVAYAFWALAHDGLISAVLCLVLGWLIDVDHEIDYAIQTGHFINPTKLGTDLKALAISSGRLILPFHALEWIYIAAVVSAWVYPIPFIPLIAYFAHLLMDIVGNGMRPLGMLITVRALSRWNVRTLVKEERLRQ